MSRLVCVYIITLSRQKDLLIYSIFGKWGAGIGFIHWPGWKETLQYPASTVPHSVPHSVPHTLRTVSHTVCAQCPTQFAHSVPHNVPHSLRTVSHTVCAPCPTQFAPSVPHSLRSLRTVFHAVSHTVCAQCPTLCPTLFAHSIQLVLSHTICALSLRCQIALRWPFLRIQLVPSHPVCFWRRKLGRRYHRRNHCA